MAQIFISHSKLDKEFIHFFLEAFAGTRVKPHLEELEEELPSGINAQRIERDVQASNAVFVLLSENVEGLKHTRDWINWECGTAFNKPIWVFEPIEASEKITIIIPHLNHYALFEKNEEWRKYLRLIIESYDDSNVLPTLSVAAGSGALLNEKDRWSGGVWGFGVGLVGLLLKNLSNPSFGISIQCWNCNSNYKIHHKGFFRCPVCNAKCFLSLPNDEQTKYQSEK